MYMIAHRARLNRIGLIVTGISQFYLRNRAPLPCECHTGNMYQRPVQTASTDLVERAKPANGEKHHLHG